MGRIDKEVRLEVLSVLTGASVRPYTTYSGRSKTNDLNVHNFVSSSLTYHANVPLRLAGLGRSSYRDELFVDLDELFDPDYDYDFTHCKDRSECWRGDEVYKRPCGWYRIAVKVLDKYRDGNEWLGTDGWRSYSVAGEWPVSYHGTSIEGAKGILSSHYKAGPRDLYGRGIYSTYDIDEASDYCKEFKSKTNGKTYRVLMQNRINPQMRKVCDRKDYWLIEIHRGSSPEKEREIVKKSIRPYGILIKEV
ncbi:hypothetical protein E1301_Tti009190 [Triplophysa tibetana]|uniref:PARP catalytic domain-containing protein n=1 Tax=Triplophysa tibetana TaxID=1572043 RepID=A0A5A9NUD4_9TELE|nr:hypothetical protein E1301_Tti009190 [Triplophysa tibetana]